jgi:hypothetical protein|tara:strand:- start:1729 stop:1998 length:270 start_codon:yes stop_codon:yes gene_type:complete
MRFTDTEVMLKASYIGNAFLLVAVMLLCLTVRGLTKANAGLTSYINTTLTKLEQNQSRLIARQSEQMVILLERGPRAYAREVLSDPDDG